MWQSWPVHLLPVLLPLAAAAKCIPPGDGDGSSVRSGFFCKPEKVSYKQQLLVLLGASFRHRKCSIIIRLALLSAASTTKLSAENPAGEVTQPFQDNFAEVQHLHSSSYLVPQQLMLFWALHRCRGEHQGARSWGWEQVAQPRFREGAEGVRAQKD